MKNFVVTADARQDMFDIWDFIADKNIDAADRLTDKFEATFEKLGQSPGIGHFREELLDRRFKFWSVYSYVIVYRFDVKPIQIIAVVHGARDLDTFFSERDK